MNLTRDQRLSLARDSLEGLSVGDAFGEGFFMSWELAVRLSQSGKVEGPPFDFTDEFMAGIIAQRELPALPWKWTDDTAMALSVYETLREEGRVAPDVLARKFSRRFNAEPARGYGAAMHSLLPRLAFEDWRMAAPNLFDGQGSFGNGGAMRVAPIGAYWCDDLERVGDEAAISAQITHAHPEGVAGAIAVAVGAALCARQRLGEATLSARDFLNRVQGLTPPSETRDGLCFARGMADEENFDEVCAVLGTGENISAPDTVPFCLWCAARHPNDYEAALWLTVAGLGDRDTTCAIVGGMVGAGVGREGIPAEWRAAREALPV